MKVLEFIKTRNISLRSLNEVCEFLHLEKKRINSKLTAVEIKLLDQTLTEESFKNWWNLKKQILSLQLKRAEMLVKNLNHDSKTEIDEYLGYQIIYALQYLLAEGRFSTEIHKNLTPIINSNEEIGKKVALLKQQLPFAEIDRLHYSNKSEQKKLTKYYYKSKRDPYENFHWGGLSGEEAYDGYWNTE
jgi:hypothetical protein